MTATPQKPETATAQAPALLPQDAPVRAAPQATATHTAPPGAGGSYLRDPLTGALTLVTPSTIQE